MQHEQKNAIGIWVESLPTSVAMIRIRLGHGNTLQTVQTIAINDRGYSDNNSEFAPLFVEAGLPLVDAIAESLIENGYGSHDGKKARLHAHRGDGKQIKTKSLTSDGARAQSAQDIAMLRIVDGLMESNAEIRRVITVLSDTLSHSHERLREAQDDTIESRADALNHQFDAMALDLLLDDDGEDESGVLKDGAALVLQEVVGMFTGSQNGGGPSKDDVLKWCKDTDFVSNMMSDPEIQSAIFEAYSNQNTPPADE